jgi:hypothetical protein
MSDFKMIVAGLVLLLLSFSARSARISDWLFGLGWLLIAGAAFAALVDWLHAAQPFNPIVNGARF